MKTLFFNHLKTYHVYYCFNLGVFIGGILFGFYYISFQSPENVSILSQSILDIFQGTTIQNMANISQHIIQSLIVISIIYALSLSVIALPILPIILFYKSMQLGFTAALYLITFETKGIVGIIFTLIPYIFFEFIAYFTSFAISYELSLSILITSFIKKQTLNYKEVFSHIFNSIIWTLCFLMASVLTQIYVLPFIFKIFIS